MRHSSRRKKFGKSTEEHRKHHLRKKTGRRNAVFLQKEPHLWSTQKERKLGLAQRKQGSCLNSEGNEFGKNPRKRCDFTAGRKELKGIKDDCRKKITWNPKRRTGKWHYCRKKGAWNLQRQKRTLEKHIRKNESMKWTWTNQCYGSMTFWYGYGSVPLINVSESGSRSCSFRQWPSRRQQNIFFLIWEWREQPPALQRR
jgi:hypothetical protein